MAKGNSAYPLLVAKAEELASEGYLQIFKDDLTRHDKEALEAVPEGTPFIWCIREHGTWIFTKPSHLDPTKSDTWRRSAYRCMEDFFAPQGEKHKVFHYDGKRLVMLKNADHGQRILREWEGRTADEA